MNYKEKLIAALLLVIMMIPSLGHSQSISKRPDIKEGASQLQKKWEPVYAFKDYNNIMQSSPTDVGTPNLTNIKNGVSFYKKGCSSVKNVVLLKLVNSNNYSVKTSWQLSADLPVTFVVVPANSEMEGSCSVTNGGVISKLTIQVPEGSNKEQIKEYTYAHIFVTELKK